MEWIYIAGAVVIALLCGAALWWQRSRPATAEPAEVPADPTEHAPAEPRPPETADETPDAWSESSGGGISPIAQGRRGETTLGYLALNEPLLGAPSRFAITNSVFRLGRSSDNDLTVKDPSVSRHHAEIRMHQDGTFTVNDLDSMNGVYVNDKRVRSAPLNEGDRVEFGDLSTTFTFSAEQTGEETLMLTPDDDVLVDLDFHGKGAA